MAVTAGAVVAIDGSATSGNVGFAVGGSRTVRAGGTGTLTLDGAGSTITVVGTQPGFNVGFDNTCLNGGPCNMPSTGTLTVSGGGQLLASATTRGSIGGTPGSTGTAIVTGGGSLLDAGAFLGLGKDRDGNPGGTATLTIDAGGTVKAATINCGAGATINGHGGTLEGTVITDPGCVISPGNSPGTLSVRGQLVVAGGKIVLEVDAFGNHDVLAVQGTASFDPSTQIEIRIDPALQPSGGVILPMLQVQATPTAEPVPLLIVGVAEDGSATLILAGDLKQLTDPIVVRRGDVEATVRAVEIDIKPGEVPNVINLNSAGSIPVAIISTPAFNALTVKPETISLHSLSAPGMPNVQLVGKSDRPLCSSQDANDDGLPDLVCHIVTSTLPLIGESIAVLDAVSFPPGGPADGIPIRGGDFVKIVP
jgi:T5SS/PEP-CTERM-associated repeat protein